MTVCKVQSVCVHLNLRSACPFSRTFVCSRSSGGVTLTDGRDADDGGNRPMSVSERRAISDFVRCSNLCNPRTAFPSSISSPDQYSVPLICNSSLLSDVGLAFRLFLSNLFHMWLHVHSCLCSDRGKRCENIPSDFDYNEYGDLSTKMNDSISSADTWTLRLEQFFQLVYLKQQPFSALMSSNDRLILRTALSSVSVAWQQLEESVDNLCAGAVFLNGVPLQSQVYTIFVYT